MKIRIMLLFFLMWSISVMSYALEDRFIDTGDDIIMDNETGLMWTKNADLADRYSEDAQSYADNFVLSGYVDWRAPTVSEVEFLLQGLYERGKHGLFDNLYYDGGYGKSCGYTNSPVFFENQGEGFQYCVEDDDTSYYDAKSAPLPAMPDTVKFWLVRQGPHATKRYTQTEVNDLIADALREIGETPIVLDTDSNCSDSDSYEEGYQAGKQYCMDNPEECRITSCDGGDAGITLSPELNLYIPSMTYNTLLGDLELWGNFEFYPNENGELLWKLTEYAEVE